MTENKKVLTIGFTLFAGFVFIGALGGLNSINQTLTFVIEENPLPRYYFKIYLFMGLLVPLILRTFKKDQLLTKSIIDPYLILLFLQILTEVTLVLSLGKGIGVIIGLIFSSTRLIQLKLLLKVSKGSTLMRLFLYMEMILWGFNVIQIGVNRILNLII